jgi:MFS family permease
MEEISAFRRCIMWFCAACFYGYQFILRVSPGVIANDLMGSLMIDACMLGTIVSFYYHGYSIMQVPTGLIIDRLGVGRPLSVACLLCSLGSIIFTFGESATILSIGRGLMGIGSAFGFLSCVKVSSQNFAPQRMALFISLTMVIGTVGGTSGGAPFAKIVSMIGWRETYKLMAVIGIVLSVIILLVFRKEHTQRHAQVAAAARSENIFLGILHILRSSQTWIYGLYGFMMYVPLSGFADLWAAPYIEEALQVDRTTAGGVVSMFYSGLAIGATPWSMYVARVKSYNKGMLWSGIITGLCVVSVIYVVPKIDIFRSIALESTYLLMALAGAASAGQFVAFAGISASNLPHRTATASGVHNMLCMSSGVILMPLIGALLNTVSSPSLEGALPHYTAADFQVALSIIPFSILIAIIAMGFIKESYPADHKSGNHSSGLKPAYAQD